MQARVGDFGVDVNNNRIVDGDRSLVQRDVQSGFVGGHSKKKDSDSGSSKKGLAEKKGGPGGRRGRTFRFSTYIRFFIYFFRRSFRRAPDLSGCCSFFANVKSMK